MDIDQGPPDGVIVMGSDGQSYRFPAGSDPAVSKTRLEARLGGRTVRPTAEPSWRDTLEEVLARGGAAADPTGPGFGNVSGRPGVIARTAANMIAHPIDNAPAIGAMAATALTGGTAAIPVMIAAGLGGAGGSGVRSIYNQFADEGTKPPANPDDVVGNMAGEAALNALLAGVAFKAPAAFRSAGNAFGRAAAKIPASITERVPGFRDIGQAGGRRAIIDKMYDKGIVPGSADAAYQVRKGPGGIDELNTSLGPALAAADQAGVRFNAGTEIAPPIRGLRARYAKNPMTAGGESVAAVQAELNSMRAHPGLAQDSTRGPWRVFRKDVTPSALNEMKVEANRGISEGAWQQKAPAGTTAQKAFSGRAAQLIRNRVPGAAAILDDEAMMIPAEEAMSLAAARAGNTNPFTLGGLAAGGPVKTTVGLLQKTAPLGYTGYGLDKLGRLMAGAPFDVRQAVLQALRSQLPSLRTEKR